MAVQTSTGLVIALSASLPATEDSAGYGALTYTDVGEVTAIGDVGANTQMVPHEALASGVTVKFKGFTDYGSVAVDMALDDSDAGQAIIDAAVDAVNTQYSVKLTFPNGGIRYWYGKAFSNQEGGLSANSIISKSVQFEIDSKIVKV